MNTAVLPEAGSPVRAALDDIARFGPQFIHEQGIHGVDVEQVTGGVTIRLKPGEAGNSFACTAEFQSETTGDALRIAVTEHCGTTGSHQPPMFVLDLEDQKRCGLLPWLRLWAAAWVDQARRS